MHVRIYYVCTIFRTALLKLKLSRLFYYKSMHNKNVCLITGGIFCIFKFIAIMKQSVYFSKHEKCGLESCNVLFTITNNSQPLKFYLRRFKYKRHGYKYLLRAVFTYSKATKQ